MAEFYAYRIMDGKTTYAKVPMLLKTAVAQILTDCGYGQLVQEG